MTTTRTQARRRWTVRNGTDGRGRGMFEVYAVTMDEARDSVKRSAEESGDLYLRGLVDAGFTVHAAGARPGSVVRGLYRELPLCLNKWAQKHPAPDFPRELATA